MKKLYALLLLTLLLTCRLTAEEKNSVLPLTLETAKKDLQADTQRHYYKNSYVTLKIQTESGDLKLRCIKRKIYFDSNGDGKIDTTDEPYGSNRILKIPATVCGQKINYPILINYVSNQAVMLKSLLYLKTSFNGKEIIIIDSNLNGKFIPNSGDQIKIEDKKYTLFASTMMIDDKIYSVKADVKKMQFTISPYRGKYAKLKLETEKDWKVTLHLQHNKTKLLITVDTSKEATILPGQYTIRATEATLYGPVDDDDDLFAAFDAEPPVKLSFKRTTQTTSLPQLKEGGNKIVCGPPLKLEVTVKQSNSKDWRSISLSKLGLKGVLGEEYSLESTGEMGKSLLANYIRSGSTEKMLAKMEYG